MKLTDKDIKYISANLSDIYYANLVATRQLTELFERLTYRELKTPDDYVKMYDDCFCTYETWEELIKSETVFCGDGLSAQECFDELNISIWQLPYGWYVQYI